MRFERGRMPGSNTRAGNEETGMINRKLIRPTLSEIQDQMGTRMPRRKPAPPEQTNAENFYFQKQMQSKTPMVIVMLDDEEVHGIIEWYDRACIKVNRTGAPNLMIYKPSIKYMYKEAEGRK